MKKRLIIGYAAVLCAVPYLTLKILWLSGNGIGFSDPSVLREPSMLALNAVTAAMDAVAIVVALVLTHSWGMRLPAWAVVFPMWVATGLLGPIAISTPISALSGDVSPGAGPVQPWVYTVVYSGFSLQGVLLAIAFVLYARARWEPLFVAGQQPLTDTAGLQLALVNLGSVLALGVAVVDLNAFALAGAIGMQMLVRGRNGWGPLAAAWLGSGAMFSWGLWSMVVVLGGTPLGRGGLPVLTAFTELAKVLGGAVLGIVLLFLMAERTRSEGSA
ncbi:hypothetical protein NLX83_02445 [Allokutzneria sp. A3M-2-11 16]|uniref:hypothetical protein n=1 Tax=Allokutzneria sp. A3M-2-11 16 TaxID=2962043 RepID=UPI0020B7D002|nr:hypothetical protein [Allokutzneria sp. A3M-2-11 16]MCP3798107.1 hypothetical protein [Allokutzneria sp. A3M-2-11 16]